MEGHLNYNVKPGEMKIIEVVSQQRWSLGQV